MAAVIVAYQVSNAGQQPKYAEGSYRFPSYSAQDFVEYADYVLLTEVVSVKQAEPSEENLEIGEDR